MLVRSCSKFFKLGFSSTWTKNFQMYKLGLEKAEEPGIKLTTFTESQRKQGNSRKIATLVPLTTLKPLTVWTTTNCGKFWEMGVTDHLTYLLRSIQTSCIWVKKQQLEPDLEQQQPGSKLGKENVKAVYCLLIWLLCSVLVARLYLTLIRRWYHSNGRNWRGTKEPLDEGERGEWKTWLETQHS